MSELIRSRPPTQSIGSPASLSLIRSWSNICQRSHAQCQVEDSTILPSRVIDVGTKGGSQEPRLFLTKGTRGRWIALSHCWGNTKPLSTTVASERKMQNGVSGLPPTFQDAVFLTRQLGIQYLWIDSLCILQDSREDWLAEAAQMGRIYSDALLVIQVNTPDSSRSILGHSDEQNLYWIEVPFTMDSQDLQGRVFIGGKQSNITTPLRSPVNERAWCLQESLMSHRSVSCGPDGLIWVCRQQLGTDRCLRPFKNWNSWNWSDVLSLGAFLRWELKLRFWN